MILDINGMIAPIKQNILASGPQVVYDKDSSNEQLFEFETSVRVPAFSLVILL